ncbi:MAG: tryptophan synthase subunit alpha [Opitutales bacterium]|nr:tryptophan synthase subunit alpha [Opitutales bacterium]
MRYQKMFSRLSQCREGAFIPFVVLGDPDPASSEIAIEALISGGADALELGFPFSDPLADGPTIQEADNRALAAGTRVDDCFKIIARIRSRHPDLPMGLLVYANLIYHRGNAKFFEEAKAAGADSLLIADVPVEMSDDYLEISKRTGLPLVFIAPPNADLPMLEKIARYGNAYTYLLSRAGVTGTENRAGTPVGEVLDVLKSFGAPPAVLGFGIAEPSQVRAAIAAGTSGAISGSAVVKIIERLKNDVPAMATALQKFSAEMKAGTRI